MLILRPLSPPPPGLSGKWEDLKLGSDCRSATGNFVFTGYTDPPADFGDSWLAGNTSWVADEVEVYYVPELANASSPRCTLASPSQPPTTAAPTTAAPTYDGETLAPTAAPSSSAPTAPPTQAPATGSPTASPEGSPLALGILKDMQPRITAIDAAENPYRGFLDLRVVRGGTMHSPATVWSAVCGTGWTEVNSQVACRQMGLRGGQTLSCPDCTRTSTSFWTISEGCLGSLSPHTRRVLCSTWLPCLLDACWCLRPDVTTNSRPQA